ncbi:MAG: hypothetical protein AB8B78_02760 [Polaribacter sp.]
MRKIKIKLATTLLSLTICFFLVYSCSNDENQITEEFSTIELPLEFQSKISKSAKNENTNDSELFTEDYTFNLILNDGTNIDVKFRASGKLNSDGLTSLEIENNFFEKTGLSPNFLTENQSKVSKIFKNKILSKKSCWAQCKEDRETGFGRAICRTGCVLKDIARIAKELALTIAAINLL